MKLAFAITLIIMIGFHVHAQDELEEIEVLLSARVDKSSEDVQAIIQLYKNYLNSNPDSIYDNPYWNKREKDLYRDFDFSRSSLFQGGITPHQLCQTYPPYILSIEPIKEKYQIRILFSSSNLDPEYLGSKVWCIQKLNVVKENGNWVLENLIVELSKDWSTRKVGLIEYQYPQNHEFDLSQAELSSQFCENIIERFNPTYHSSFQYYVTSSIDDMGLLENFDYYFVGSTIGKAREKMIFSANGNEYYPHEFVHQLLPKNSLGGHLIEEGLATYLGTKMNAQRYKTYYLAKLAYDLNNCTKINFQSVVALEIKFNGYQTAYPAGAALCELVFNKAGDDGLSMLMKANTSDYKNVISAVRNITQLTIDEIKKEWKAIVLTYAD